jgi:hypothetical protein
MLFTCIVAREVGIASPGGAILVDMVVGITKLDYRSFKTYSNLF